MRLQVYDQRIACDGCTACCHVFAVPELDKAGYAPCRHLTATAGGEGHERQEDPEGRAARPAGCGIHADRPRVCRDFVCAYAMGLLGDSILRRPDRSGLLMQLAPPHRLQVWEVRAGAFDDTDRLTYLVRKALAGAPKGASQTPVALFPFGSSPGAGLVDWDRFYAFENWLVFKG
jgi:hypothetical protein